MPTCRQTLVERNVCLISDCFSPTAHLHITEVCLCAHQVCVKALKALDRKKI